MEISNGTGSYMAVIPRLWGDYLWWNKRTRHLFGKIWGKTPHIGLKQKSDRPSGRRAGCKADGTVSLMYAVAAAFLAEGSNGTGDDRRINGYEERGEDGFWL